MEKSPSRSSRASGSIVRKVRLSRTAYPSATYGSQGYFRTSGRRFSRCAVMNSFASSVM